MLPEKEVVEEGEELVDQKMWKRRKGPKRGHQTPMPSPVLLWDVGKVAEALQ